MAQFPLKFMINGTILILILLISRFLMETSLDVHHMAFIYLSLFVSLEHLLTCRNKVLTAKLLKQDYRYHKLLKDFFLKFYRRHSELVEKYNISLRKLLQQDISEPEFYGDLVYRIRKIVSKSNFSEQFRKLINRYERIGYNPYVMRQAACLVINPTSVDSYASLFNCTTVGRASDSMTASA